MTQVQDLRATDPDIHADRLGLPQSTALVMGSIIGVGIFSLPYAIASYGPYAYARAAFGNGLGFSNAWSYWITAWAGNAAIAVGWVFYVETFVNKGGAVGWSILIALTGLWIPAGVNLIGVRTMGVFQLWTTVLKFVPLALMSTVGLFFVTAGSLGDAADVIVGAAGTQVTRS